MKTFCAKVYNSVEGLPAARRRNYFEIKNGKGAGRMFRKKKEWPTTRGKVSLRRRPRPGRCPLADEVLQKGRGISNTILRLKEEARAGPNQDAPVSTPLSKKVRENRATGNAGKVAARKSFFFPVLGRTGGDFRARGGGDPSYAGTP